MPARKRRQPGWVREGPARVGWAKYFDEVRHSQQLEHAHDVLIDRIETLIPELLELTDDVLYERNITAFQRAYRVKSLVEEYQRGARAS
jgi:hypothetical protein